MPHLLCLISDIHSLIPSWNDVKSISKSLPSGSHISDKSSRLPANLKHRHNLINDGNRTELSLIQSVIIWAINKIGQPRSGSPINFVQSPVRLQPELDDNVLLPILIITITIFVIFRSFFKLKHKNSEIPRVFCQQWKKPVSCTCVMACTVQLLRHDVNCHNTLSC